MNRLDFSDYKFRCHALGKLMVNSRTKGKLSQTTLTYLDKIFKEEVFNRREEIKSKYLDKGIQCEEQSIALYEEVSGNTFFIKNGKRFRNHFFSGEPDNIQGKVRDFKTSWDYTTFPMTATEIPNKDYYYQLQGYMDLTGIREAELIYCLVDTPPEMVADELRRISWKLGMLEVPDDLAEEITTSMYYSDIPKALRVKIFEVEYDEDVVNQMKERVNQSRKYLNKLVINIAERNYEASKLKN